MSQITRDEILEEFQHWLDDINSLDSGYVILVEGRKDVRSLKSLGVDRRIYKVNRGYPIVDLVDHVANGTGPFRGKGPVEGVVILTDWDRKGGQLASSLAEYCRTSDVKYDLEFRRRLAILLGRWIKDVESANSIIAGLKEERIKV